MFLQKLFVLVTQKKKKKIFTRGKQKKRRRTERMDGSEIEQHERSDD